MIRSMILFSCMFAIALVCCVDPCMAEGKKVDYNKLLQKKVPLLLEFGRGWCKPCKYMKPILKDIAKAYGPRAVVCTVDMGVNRELNQAFKIRMMPTQVFILPDGREFHRNIGTLERDQIIQIFAKMGLPPPAKKNLW